MRRSLSQALVLGGIGLVLLAGGFWARNEAEDRRAGESARLLLQETKAARAEPAPGAPLATASTATSDEQAAAVTDSLTGNAAAPPIQRQLAMDVMGVLSIPALDLELPVLKDCTPALLKISVCRYAEGAPEDERRIVIAGHNYKAHFQRLSELAAGDPVTLSLPGEERRFVVSSLERVSGSDVPRLWLGEWNLTLLTCTYGGEDRVLVRCTAQ